MPPAVELSLGALAALYVLAIALGYYGAILHYRWICRRRDH